MAPTQPLARSPNRRCANRPGARLATSASQCMAFRTRRSTICTSGRPTHPVPVESSQYGIEDGLTEAPIIVDPPLHDAVEHPRQIIERLSLRLAMCHEQISRPIATTRVPADRWQETPPFLSFEGAKGGQPDRMANTMTLST